MLYIPASFKYIVFAPQKIPYSGGGLFATFIVMMCDKTFVNLQPKKKGEKKTRWWSMQHGKQAKKRRKNTNSRNGILQRGWKRDAHILDVS